MLKKELGGFQGDKASANEPKVRNNSSLSFSQNYYIDQINIGSLKEHLKGQLNANSVSQKVTVSKRAANSDS